MDPLGGAVGRGDCEEGAGVGAAATTLTGVGADTGALAAGGTGAASAALTVGEVAAGTPGSRGIGVARLGAESGGAAGDSLARAAVATDSAAGSLDTAGFAAAGAMTGSSIAAGFGAVSTEAVPGSAGVGGLALMTSAPLAFPALAVRCSSRDRRPPRRCESRAGGAAPVAADLAATSTDCAMASVSESALTGASLAVAERCGLPFPAPPRRRREEPDSVAVAVLLPLSLDFAAVFSSTVSSVVAVPSAAGRLLPARDGMLRRPNTPGLMRTRSVDGRRASACSRDCIISSGSRPTTDSRSYFSARRVKSLK